MSEIISIILTLLITILTVAKVYIELKKESQRTSNLLLENLQQMILKIETSNKAIIEKLGKLIALTKQGKEEIIVENQKQMNVIRSGLNLRQKMDWITEMINIYQDNNLLNKSFVLEKIETKTNNVLFKTDLDYRNIKGTNDYLIGYENIIKFLRENDIYEQIYAVLLEFHKKAYKCSYLDGNCTYFLRKDLGSLWDITQARLFNEYKQYMQIEL